jgi:N-acetylglucosaminyl-diphospho-decaprenol L-rhamnosyltransferase
MVHFGEVSVTAQAVACAVAQTPDDARFLLLDNGSGAGGAAAEALRSACPPRVTILRGGRNLGFAAGMNLLIGEALADPVVGELLLLNNDTLGQSGFHAAMHRRLDAVRRVEMVAARLVRADAARSVDSLGITLYRSGLGSNRKRTDERLLGPTGGCMLVTRRVLEELRDVDGEWFDETFFCYAEDTDLVMRARWLGFDSAYADDAVVVHHGSLSSGGPDNEFVLYHGIRNSIWALAKNAPAMWLFAHLPWIVVAHGAIWLRNLRKGRAKTLWRLYRDAFRGLPSMLRKRKVVRLARRVSARAWWRWVEPSLYERAYLRSSLRELFTGRRKQH